MRILSVGIVRVRDDSCNNAIDDACGITGNCLLVGEGPPDDIRAMFVGVYARGERQADLEREYLQVYHPLDEAVPRLRQLPDSQLVPIADLCVSNSQFSRCIQA